MPWLSAIENLPRPRPGSFYTMVWTISSRPSGGIMTRSLFDLSGKVALVTGGSKGLGKAMARGLAEAGADIVICSRHEEELRTALDEILAGTGRRGRYLVADMSRRPEADRLARTALEQMGRVDILVNNA